MTPEIINRENCIPEEIESLRKFLLQSPVRWIVNHIDNGARVSKGEIHGLSSIGNLKTFWSNLGDIYSIKEHRIENFLVSQVMDALSKPQCKDKITYVTIKKYINQLANNQLKTTITLIETNDELVIVDGNKSTVACFEYGLKSALTDLRLPVFIISY